MRLRTKILLAIVLTLLAGDVLGTIVVQNRLADGAQREANNQAVARAQEVRSLYQERSATLVAEGQAISLYPAVIAALVGNNPGPLRQWSGEVANLQGTSVTVTDASGIVVSRGHAPDLSGDDLSGQLGGLRLALAGQDVSGVESGDELGAALRGYVPVRQNGLDGPIVGAVMIADPLDDRFLDRLSGGDAAASQMRLDPTPAPDSCTTTAGLVSTCHVSMASPSGEPAASVAFDVPLSEVQHATSNAQSGLWLVSLLVLVAGAIAAWFLARSLTRPLAHLTAASQRIAAGSFDQPVQVSSHDGVGSLATAFEQMRQQVADMTERLREERDVLDAVLGSTGDGILMVDPHGQTVVANKVWTDLVGEASLGAASSLTYTENPEVEFGTLAERWLADAEHVAAADLERVEPYLCLRVYSAPVRFHGEGPILGRIFVLRDVTRETEAERMRSALLATVSHELRSPLTAISGYADTLLQDGPWDDQTQREFLEVIALSASQLSGLVDNLLDAATLDAGVLSLQREPVRVERIAERVLAQRRLLATNWTLHLETRPGLPLADADPIRVEQVLANLVDNAIKYSPGGGPIRVRVWPTEDGQVGVSVSDHGSGIPPEAVEHLFERFYRVDGGRVGVKGAGLGLFICKSLVEAHGGRIAVQSTPGQGSTFWFTLPALAEASDADRQPLGVGSGAEVWPSASPS
ncbi:MAG: HAMP domain-containing protein [Chloroflexi bacterium]|nr:HAMP domain-containing protein [Chloroflexota bacterium]